MSYPTAHSQGEGEYATLLDIAYLLHLSNLGSKSTFSMRTSVPTMALSTVSAMKAQSQADFQYATTCLISLWAGYGFVAQ